jgi:tetratricopeptide (TPR) repeat protein
LALASVLILTALAAAAWRQAAYWRNSETLWTRELSFPEYNNAVAPHYNFGLTLGEQGRHREAAEQYEAALAIDPHDESSHLNLGLEYEALDDADAAIEQYRAMIKDNPKSASGHRNLARLLKARGDDAEAAEHLRAAEEEEPSSRDTCGRPSQ